MRALIFLLIAISFAQDDSIFFIEIPQLTLYKGQFTKARRLEPIKQIQCVSGDACKYYEPEVIHCTNMGVNDMRIPQWKCQAEMPTYYQFGKTEVSCEGYSKSGDPIVLRGSCGVEYTLHLTEQGKQHHLYTKKEHNNTTDVLSFFAFIGILMIILCVLVLCCGSSRQTVYVEPLVVKNPRRQKTVYVEENQWEEPAKRYPTRKTKTVIHNHNNDSGPGFFTGYAMGTMTSKPSHTTNYYSTSTTPTPTTTYYTPESPKEKEKTNTNTSTGYGGSKSR